MKCFFDAEQIVKVYCSPEEHSCVRLAVQDFLSDLYKRSGRVAELCTSPEAANVLIGTVGVTEFGEADVSALRGKEEHFSLIPFERGLLIAGSDKRGTMWGIYECCKRYLHVDPLYLWTDHEPGRCESLPMPAEVYSDGPHTYRFRGWFINDEDLLEGFCKGEKPEKGYRFHKDYRNALDMLIETSLRLKQNMIIPCSHLDILKPEEEALVKRITERGLYISMHHQEPVGINQNSMERLWKEQHGENETVNFIDHPDFYRSVWKQYIHRWAQHEDVIWQLGMRGRGDRPVWYQNERAPETTAARGKLISDAIRMQMDLIREECPNQPILSTATLWMEGMPLYKAGALAFPEGTMVIQSDFGPNQMWGEGYHETPRYPGTEYGLYYHLAFWGCGPHLIQGNRPEKIRFNFQQAMEKGDTAYVVLNVSNFREFVYGVRYEAQLTWNMEEADAEADRADWCKEQFEVTDSAAIEDVYREYFQCFVSMDDSSFPAQMTFNDGMARRVAVKLMQIIRGSELIQEDIQNKRLYAFPDTDSFVSHYCSVTQEGLERFNRVHAKALAAAEQIPGHRKNFYNTNVLVQIEIMLGMYGWVNALCRAAQNRRAGGDNAVFRTLIEEAIAALNQAIENRQKAQYGRFCQWYDGDRLMNLPESAKLTAELLSSAEVLHTAADLSRLI